jgi:Metallo-beta-lactamase-like, C-terminal domain
VIAACGSPHSAAELLPRLFARRLDAHETGFALGEALAHLNYLATLGEIERVSSEDGVDRFITADAPRVRERERSR